MDSSRALRIEQEAEFHRFGHRDRGRADPAQPCCQRVRRLAGLRDIALPALDRAVNGLAPEEQVVRGVVGLSLASVRAISTRAVVQSMRYRYCPGRSPRQFSMSLKAVSSFATCSSSCRQWTDRARDGAANARAPRESAATRRDTGHGDDGRRGRVAPLAGRVCHSNQVRGEVAAVHRRDVARLQRTRDRGCRTSCRSGRGKRCRRLMVARVASSAPPRRVSRSSQSRGR